MELRGLNSPSYARGAFYIQNVEKKLKRVFITTSLGF